MNRQNKNICYKTVKGYPAKFSLLATLLILLFFSVNAQANCYPDSKTEKGTGNCYYFDMHLHYENFVQETQGFDRLHQEMKDNNIQKTVLFGLGYSLAWDNNRLDRAIYYFQKDEDLSDEANFILGTDLTPPLYFDKEGDYILINDYKAAAQKYGNEIKDKVFPFLQAIDPTDKNEIYYVTKMFKRYPEFCGIGEVLIHKGAMNRTTYKQPYANTNALDPILDFAQANGLPFLFHQNIGDETANSTYQVHVEPKYMQETLDMVRRHKNNTFIWAHTGISRYLYPGYVQDHIERLNKMLEANDNLYFDISWFVWDAYIENHIEDWRVLIEKHKTRFMIGSDKIGNFVDGEPLRANEREFLSSQALGTGQGDEILKYNLLLSVLEDDTAALLAHGNIERILSGVQRGCKTNNNNFVYPWKYNDTDNEWVAADDPWEYEKYNRRPSTGMEVMNSLTNQNENINIMLNSSISEVIPFVKGRYYRWNAVLTPNGTFNEFLDSPSASGETKYPVSMFEEPFFAMLTNSDNQIKSLMVGDDGGLFMARYPYSNSDDIMYPGGSRGGESYWMEKDGYPSRVNVPYNHLLTAFSDEYYADATETLKSSWEEPWQSLPSDTGSIILAPDKTWADMVWYAPYIYNGAAASEVFVEVFLNQDQQYIKKEKVVKVGKVDDKINGIQTIVKTRIPYSLEGINTYQEDIKAEWYAEYYIRCLPNDCQGSVELFFIDTKTEETKTFTHNLYGNEDFGPHGLPVKIPKQSFPPEGVSKELVFGLKADVNIEGLYIESIALRKEVRLNKAGIWMTAGQKTSTGVCTGEGVFWDSIIVGLADLTNTVEQSIGGTISCIQSKGQRVIQFFDDLTYEGNRLGKLNCDVIYSGSPATSPTNEKMVNSNSTISDCVLLPNKDLAAAKSLKLLPAFSITVFKDPGFQGDSKVYEITTGNYEKYTFPDWDFDNDRISSVILNSSEVEVLLWQHSNYSGDSKTVRRDYRDLGSFHNKTSSLVVMKKQVVESDEIVVYEDYYYGSDTQTFSMDMSSLYNTDIGNNTISSIVVGESIEAFLCDNDNYEGDCRRVSGEVVPVMKNSDTELGNRVNSVKILDQNQFISHNMEGGNYVKLYRHSGFTGDVNVIQIAKYEKYKAIHRFSSNGIDNDSISSVAFGDGIAVYLFEHVDYKGKYVRLLNSNIRLSDLSFNDKASSMIIVREDSVIVFGKDYDEYHENRSNTSYGRFSVFFPQLDKGLQVDSDNNGIHNFGKNMTEIYFNGTDSYPRHHIHELDHNCLFGWEEPKDYPTCKCNNFRPSTENLWKYHSYYDWCMHECSNKTSSSVHQAGHCRWGLKKFWNFPGGGGGGDPQIIVCNTWADIRFNDHDHSERLKLRVYRNIGSPLGTSYYSHDTSNVYWINQCGSDTRVDVTLLRFSPP